MIKKSECMNKTETAEAFGSLYEILIRLRDPLNGCPWDIEQTPLSMRSDLLEEAFEAVEAISEEESGSDTVASSHVCEELGDVFLNTAMIAYMHEQAGSFSLADSLHTVSEKLLRRHPHVFADSNASTSEEVLKQWDVIKRVQEGRGGESVLDEVSLGLPPLMRALKLQKKASKKGFDWVHIEDVWKKVEEEMDEVKEAITENKKNPADIQDAHIEEEVGDLFFALVNISRHLHIDPCVALTRASAKFTKRFKYVESYMKEHGIPMVAENFEKMNEAWNRAKVKQ